MQEVAKTEIQNIDHVRLLVNNFYGKVREDELLGPIFNNLIQDRWPEHLDKMYRFWQTVLLEEHTYNGSPFMPHAKLPVNEMHFNKWMQLFNGVIDDFFCGTRAEKAKIQAQKMADMFLYKIQYYQSRNTTPLA